MASATFPEIASPSAAWKAASDLYYEDKVVAAYEIVEPNSAAGGGASLGFYRLIEGEALTRQSAERVKLASWLDYEWVPHEVPHHVAVGQVVLAAATSSAERLQWDKSAGVLASILVSEADADWHDARYGYCIHKLPYDKICLPNVATHDPHELWRVTAHEFAHVVILNTTQQLAPHWLDEGIACLMEGRNADEAMHRLNHDSLWFSPIEIRTAFDPDRRAAANMHHIRAAYDQATVLVNYLQSLKGDQGIVDLLQAFTDHSHWKDLMTLISGKQPVDGALHQVFGFNSQELFTLAKK
jgi:hypothetical protein